MSGEEDQAVEVNLEEVLDDTTELCQLLENEKAPKDLWLTIAMAYAKQQQVGHAIDILHKGLASLGRSGPKEKIGLLGCLSWLYLLKSRHAPRVPPEGQLVSEAKTKDHFCEKRPLPSMMLHDSIPLSPLYTLREASSPFYGPHYNRRQRPVQSLVTPNVQSRCAKLSNVSMTLSNHPADET